VIYQVYSSFPSIPPKGTELIGEIAAASNGQKQEHAQGISQISKAVAGMDKAVQPRARRKLVCSLGKWTLTQGLRLLYKDRA
jgi:hypothetical protein